MRPRNDSDDSGLVDPAGWVGNISNPIRAGGWEGGRKGRRQLKALKFAPFERTTLDVGLEFRAVLRFGRRGHPNSTRRSEDIQMLTQMEDASTVEIYNVIDLCLLFRLV